MARRRSSSVADDRADPLRQRKMASINALFLSGSAWVEEDVAVDRRYYRSERLILGVRSNSTPNVAVIRIQTSPGPLRASQSNT